MRAWVRYAWEFSLLLVLKLLIDAIAYQALAMFFYEPYFGQYGEVNRDRLIAGYIVLFPLWLSIRNILVSEKYTLSKVLVAFQFFLMVLPSLTLFAQNERPAFHLFLILLGFYTFVLVIYLVPRFKLSHLPSSVVLFLAVFFGVIYVYVYIMLLTTGGLNRINFDLLNVYETRAEYREALFPFAGYFVPWVANILNISLLIFGLSYGRKPLVFLAIFAQIALFAMTNFKSHLFLVLLSLVTYFALKSLKTNFATLTLCGLVALSGVVVVLGGPIVISLFRRVFYVPVGLSGLYFDYFSQNPHSFMSGSTFARILEELGLRLPYTTSSIDIIASEFWGRQFSPNVNWIGASFADFGVLGIVFTGILLGLLAILGDSISKLVAKRGVAESLSLALGFSLTNSAIVTVLFTHGGFLALLSIWVIASISKFEHPLERRRFRDGN